jgi:hypothetical protein
VLEDRVLVSAGTGNASSLGSASAAGVVHFDFEESRAEPERSVSLHFDHWDWNSLCPSVYSLGNSGDYWQGRFPSRV